MTPELQEKLYKKYPKLFLQKGLSIQESCMVFGVECGSGWYNLIYCLCDSIQSYIDCNNKDQVEFTQMKEKYGGLRAYICKDDDLVRGMVWFAEGLSYKICEDCGSIENIIISRGWVSVKCEKCWKKHRRRIFIRGIKHFIYSFFRRMVRCVKKR